MERLAKVVENMKISMDIIDGSDDSVVEKCEELGKRIRNCMSKVDQFNEMLHVYEEQLNEQKEIGHDFEILKRKLLYIHKYYPKDLISISNEEDIPQEMEAESQPVYTCNKNVGSAKKDTSAGGCVMQEQRKTPKSTSKPQPRTVLCDKSNTMNHSTITGSTLRVPNITFSASMSDPEKPKDNLEISISYVTDKEFSLLSSYMKGRLTKENINEFVDIFNTVLNKKYSLLKKPKKAQSVAEKEQCLVWKEQEVGELIGSYFCTAVDFENLGSVKIGSKKYLSIITILRHMKRMREVRNLKIIYYVACF